MTYSRRPIDDVYAPDTFESKFIERVPEKKFNVPFVSLEELKEPFRIALRSWLALMSEHNSPHVYSCAKGVKKLFFKLYEFEIVSTTQITRNAVNCSRRLAGVFN